MDFPPAELSPLQFDPVVLPTLSPEFTGHDATDCQTSPTPAPSTQGDDDHDDHDDHDGTDDDDDDATIPNFDDSAPPQFTTTAAGPAPAHLQTTPPASASATDHRLRTLLPALSTELSLIPFHSSTLPRSRNLPPPPPPPSLPSLPPPPPLPRSSVGPLPGTEERERMKMTRLTDFEKGQIAALWEEYHHVPKIQERLLAYGGKRRSYTTIQSFVQRWKERNSHANAKAEGRPPKVNAEERRRIQAAARETGWTWARLHREVAPEIGIKTLKRVVAGDYDKEDRHSQEPVVGEKVVTRGEPAHGGRPPRPRDGTGRFAAGVERAKKRAAQSEKRRAAAAVVPVAGQAAREGVAVEGMGVVGGRGGE